LPLVGVLVSKVDTRALVAFGFLTMSASLVYMAHTMDLQMDFATAVKLRMLQSVGMAFLFVPIQTISYAGVPVQKNNQVSGIINLSRNLGGDIGIAFVTTLVVRRSQVHQAILSAHTTAYNPVYQAKLAGIARALEHAGATSVDAMHQAAAAMYAQMLQQAANLAYLDALWVLGIASAFMVPIVWLTGRPAPMGARGGH
ncbi:MAG: hypothetical protein ACREJ3_16215, partial [Polyangiaceae bacterium]